MTDRDCPYCNYTGKVHCGDVAGEIFVEGGAFGVCSNAAVCGPRKVKPTSHQLPMPGDEEASDAIDAMLKEYNYPANTKNSARAGWNAARKWLADYSFQRQVQAWMLACFGEKIAADPLERNHRFLEESLELVQACGCTKSEALQLVDYVFDRPVGEKEQEVGGVMVTLAALCSAQKLSMQLAGDVELARIWSKMESIRAKQAAKPKHSPLPEQASAGLNQTEREELNHLRKLVNTPELHSFRDAVVLEAVHQRERWGSEHDAGKQPADWFWLVGYLAGKALQAQLAGDKSKALHHTTSTAAALANWHAAITGESTTMRPGIDPEERSIKEPKDQESAITLLRLFQSNLGSMRETCNDGGKILWDRIDQVCEALK